MEPHVILFDEPTSALDPQLVGEVLDSMRQLASEGITMLVVTHEMGFAAQVADRVVFMDHGKIVEQGPPGKLFRAPESARLREFLDTWRSRNMLFQADPAPADGLRPSDKPPHSKELFVSEALSPAGVPRMYGDVPPFMAFPISATCRD